MWETYHQAATVTPDVNVVSYSLFCELWKQLTPQVVVTHPNVGPLLGVPAEQQPDHEGTLPTCGGELSGT